MNRSKALLILSILILTFIATSFYFKAGFPYTHDGENHLARFANYAVAVREGQFPPRFAPNLMNHYGYPVFNYNYPLANILSLPFSALKINFEITFKILAISSVMMGIWGMWSWLETFKSTQISKYIALTYFASSPFLISTLVFRGNIGELMAWALLPWIWWSLESVAEDSNSKIDWKLRLITFVFLSTFMLSHNISVLFGSGLLMAYLLWRLWSQRSKLISFLKIFGLAILGSFWFWIPALLEKKEIVLDNVDLSSQFTQHFPSLEQLLFSPLKFGFSYLGSLDTLSFNVGLVSIIALFGALFSWFRFYSSATKKTDNRYQFLLLISVLLLVFQLSLTTPIWEFMPFVRFIQFPWRLTLFYSFLITPVIAYTWDRSSKYLKIIIGLLLLSQLLVTFRAKPVDYFHRQIIDYVSFSQSTTTGQENLPKSFRYSDFAAGWQPTAELAEGQGFIEVEYWKGSDRSYKLRADSVVTVVEPTMYFSGWETQIYDAEGNRVEVGQLYTDLTAGRIAYSLDVGEYQIRTKFTQWTLPRMIGNSISLLVLGGVSLELILKLLGKRGLIFLN